MLHLKQIAQWGVTKFGLETLLVGVYFIPPIVASTIAELNTSVVLQ